MQKDYGDVVDTKEEGGHRWRQEKARSEMEALASSLELSLSVGQEQSRDTDTLLKSLKISEEGRAEERSRALNMRNRLLNTEVLLVYECVSVY